MKQSEPTLLTVMEAAALLRIGRTAAYLLVQRGELPAVRVGGSLRIVRADLDRYLRRPVSKEAS